MQLNLNDAQLQAVVAKALFDTMTPEKRDALFVQALQHLITPPDTGTYGRKERSPLQRVFDNEVETAARNFARDRLQNDADFKAKVERMFVDAATKLFSDEEKRGEIVDALAGAMRKAITGDRY